MGDGFERLVLAEQTGTKTASDNGFALVTCVSGGFWGG